MTAVERDITEWEFEVLTAVRDFPTSEEARNHLLLEPRQGWLTSVNVRTYLGAPSLSTRSALKALAARGLVAEKVFHSARHFRLSHKGEQRLSQPPPQDDAEGVIHSQAWTGVISPIQAEKALAIVSELEDVCEGISSNHDRAQILGLVRALELLLTIPDPPRVGVVALVRDPAFSNIVQVAAFLAALVAAIKA